MEKAGERARYGEVFIDQQDSVHIISPFGIWSAGLTSMGITRGRGSLDVAQRRASIGASIERPVSHLDDTLKKASQHDGIVIAPRYPLMYTARVSRVYGDEQNEATPRKGT